METGARFMSVIFTFNAFHKTQRFVLMERNIDEDNLAAEIELYEVPYPASQKETLEAIAEISHTQVTVYRTLLSVSSHFFTTLEEQTEEVQECPGYTFSSHRGTCSSSKTTWRSPLIKIGDVTVDDALLHRALTGTHSDRDEAFFHNIGFLETTWGCRTGSSPQPYVVIDNRRKATQAAYVDPESLKQSRAVPISEPHHNTTPHPCYEWQINLSSEANKFPTRNCDESCPKTSPTGLKYRKTQRTTRVFKKPRK